jgi:hypothetical protein
MFMMSVGLLGTSAALAQQDIVRISGAGTDQHISGNYTLGYEFQVITPITVIGLSDFADGVSTALGSAPNVALWNSAGTEVASATVTTSDPFTSDGFFRYATLSSGPIVLQAGDYFVGAYAPTGTAYSYGATGLTSVSSVKFLEFAYAYPSSGLTDENHTYSGPNTFFGGNVVIGNSLRANGDPVPDAGSSMILLSAALAGLAAFSRKK